MKVFILQRSIRKEGNHFHLIGAHQTLDGAKKMVIGYVSFSHFEEISWKEYGFSHYAETNKGEYYWKISELELVGYIAPQAEPLEFSPVPDE